MSKRLEVVIVGWLVGAGVLFWGVSAAAQSTGSASAAVMVELFTSQGCNSCPSAERVLSELNGQPGVVALAWHVDYWDNKRWSDPFSRRAFSTRQIDYAKSFKSENIYTPQMIVDGRDEFNGGDRGKARLAISAARVLPKARMSLSIHPSEEGPETIVAHIRVENLPHFVSGRVGGIILVVTEDNLRVKVGGGENANRVLEHDAVVRWARVAGETTGESFERDVSVPVDAKWKPDDLRLVGFLQDRKSQEILAVKSIAFGPSSDEN